MTTKITIEAHPTAPNHSVSVQHHIPDPKDGIRDTVDYVLTSGAILTLHILEDEVVEVAEFDTRVITP